MPAFPISGKAALITGGGSGIGYSLVALLLARGCHVLIADLSVRPEAQALIDGVRPPPPPGSSSGPAARAIFHKTDVTEWTQLEAALAAGIEEFGRIDIFVPGAGVYEPPWSSFFHPPGTSASADALHANRYKSLDINLTHPVRLAQLGISHLLSTPVKPQPTDPLLPTQETPSPIGAVVFVSSIAAQSASLLTPLYNASKAAVSSLTRSLGALEEKAGIRVAAVAPGLVLTPLWTDNPDKMKFVDQSKDEWVGPEEVAEAVVGLVEGVVAGMVVKSGTVLEVGKGSTRVVEVRNDPGSKGPGLEVTGMGIGDGLEDIVERLRRGDWGVLG